MYPRSIYKITHVPTGRVYVGSSNNPENRLKAHLSALRNGKHPVEDMQVDFEEFGENYDFSVIGQIKDKSEDHKEYDYMLEFGSNIRGHGYNYKDRKCPVKSLETQLLELIRSTDNPAITTKMATILCLTINIQEQLKELANLIYSPQDDNSL